MKPQPHRPLVDIISRLRECRVDGLLEDDDRDELERDLDQFEKMLRLPHEPNDEVTLWLVDWNRQDKFYTTTCAILEEFGTRILRDGVSSAYTWFISQVDFERNGGRVKHVDGDSWDVDAWSEDPSAYYLDYGDAVECVESWRARSG